MTVAFNDPRDVALVLMAEALASVNSADPMAQCVGACGAVPIESERTFQVVARSNADLGRAIVDGLKIPASIMAGGWALSRVTDSAGTTSVSNKVTGDGNSTAGRNNFDDHSSTIDGGIGGISQAQESGE